MEVAFFPKAEEDLIFWKNSGNKQIQKKISELIADTRQNPFAGLGQPEPLKHRLSGMWSRRINSEHRMVYDVTEDKVNIYSLRGHYHL